MEPTTIALLGRLLFEVGKWVLEDVIDAERNDQLGDGSKKHLYVRQNIMNKIDSYQEESLQGDKRTGSKYDSDILDAAKRLAASQVDRKIETAVNTLNVKGHFVKE